MWKHLQNYIIYTAKNGGQKKRETQFALENWVCVTFWGEQDLSEPFTHWKEQSWGECGEARQASFNLIDLPSIFL